MSIELWLLVFILLIGIEVATMALTTVWFAIGALGGLFASLLGANTTVQLVVFLVISFAVLYFYRPLALKYVNTRLTKTNVDDLVGKEGKITERVDNLSETGRMMVNGMDWSARTEKDGQVIEPDTIVRVIKVVGVKLIVVPLEEQERR